MTPFLCFGAVPLVTLSPERPDEEAQLDSLRARLRQGDALVHECVLRELVPLVRKWCFRVLGPRNDVDDAVQDSLAEISSALPRFEGRSSISTLAYRITMRRAVRFRHRTGAPRLVPIAPDHASVDGEAGSPERDALAREAVRRLYALLDRLPPGRRLAFVLCALESLSPAEAAKVAGTTSLVIRVRLHHARRAMREWMQQDEVLADYAPAAEERR